MKLSLFVSLLSLLAVGCSTVEPTAGKKFDVKSKLQCMDICKEADMSFQSLVVVGGMAGCVCGNKDIQKNSSVEGVMGGAIATMAASEQQNQNQKQQ